MTLYNITIHPLRLVAHLCKQGSVYVVLISRKGVDVMTKPSICAIPGEVDFSTPAELNQTKTFQLNFSSPKDRRMVQFAMYDITNHRHSVKLNVFEIPLAGMCSVLAQESICEKKAVSFRISDRPGRLEVIFRMHPVTAPVPPLKVLPPPWSAEERGNKTGDGGASENLTRLPQHVLDALKKAEMLPRDVNAVELDANIAQEITVRASLLFPTDAALRNRIQTLETEIAKFEYDAQFAAKDSVSFGSAAWNALRAELAHWEDLAKQLDAISAHQAGITSLIPSMHSTDDGDRALIADLESQLATAQAEMRSLETQENDGEVSGKLISLIDQVEQLEELLNGLRVAAPLAARKSELLGSDSSHVDQWGRLAGDLYDKESAVEQLTHTILLLNQIQTDPYRPGVEWNNTDAGPSELAFVRDNKRRLTNLPPEMRSVVGTAPPMMPATQSAMPTAPPMMPATQSAMPTAPPMMPATQSAMPTAPPMMPATQSAMPTAPPMMPATQSAMPTAPPMMPATQSAMPTAPPMMPATQSAMPTAPPMMPAAQPAMPTAPPASTSLASGNLLDDLFGTPPGANQQNKGTAALGAHQPIQNEAKVTNTSSSDAILPGFMQQMGATRPLESLIPIGSQSTAPTTTYSGATGSNADDMLQMGQVTSKHSLGPSAPPADSGSSQYTGQGFMRRDSTRAGSETIVTSQLQQQTQQASHISPMPVEQTTSTLPPAQLQTQMQQQQPPQGQDTPAENPPPCVRRPFSLSEVPYTPFPNIPLMVRACPFDVYLDGKTPTRGTELTFLNNAMQNILIGGVELRQEDVMSSLSDSGQTIPTRRWPQQMNVARGGGRATCLIALHPSVPRVSSLLLVVIVYVYANEGYTSYATRLAV